MKSIAIACLIATSSAITLNQLAQVSADPCKAGDKDCAAKFGDDKKNVTAFAEPCKEGDKDCAAKFGDDKKNATAAFADPACVEGDKRAECAAKFAEPACVEGDKRAECHKA